MWSLDVNTYLAERARKSDGSAHRGRIMGSSVEILGGLESFETARHRSIVGLRNESFELRFAQTFECPHSLKRLL